MQMGSTGISRRDVTHAKNLTCRGRGNVSTTLRFYKGLSTYTCRFAIIEQHIHAAGTRTQWQEATQAIRKSLQRLLSGIEISSRQFATRFPGHKASKTRPNGSNVKVRPS